MQQRTSSQSDQGESISREETHTGVDSVYPALVTSDVQDTEDLSITMNGFHSNHSP